MENGDLSKSKLAAAFPAIMAKQEITEVLYLYARGCDRCDEAALRACFHPDAIHRHGQFEGLSQDFCSLAIKTVKPLKACKHMVSNVMIEFDGEGRAVSECHFLSYHRFTDQESGNDRDRFHGGRYLDRFERRDGVWKITHRVGLYDFERVVDPAVSPAGRPSADLQGAQAPDDFLYTLLA